MYICKHQIIVDFEYGNVCNSSDRCESFQLEVQTGLSSSTPAHGSYSCSTSTCYCAGLKENNRTPVRGVSRNTE